jgi:hypothetical protein
MSMPADLRAYKWRARGSIRAENRWPGGPRRMPCLNAGEEAECEGLITSTGRDHRLCARCRRLVAERA